MHETPGSQRIRLFCPQRIPRPEAAPGQEEFLSRPGPLAVEIGAGVGYHPLLHSRLYPRWKIVALERTRAKFERLYRRWNNHGRPPQMLPLHSDGVWWVTHYLGPESVSRFYFLYPNPYPKPKQANQRWHFHPFMQRALSCLKPQGEIVLATNEAFYAAEALAHLPQRYPELRLSEASPWSLEQGPRTHFEKKYLLRGETCHNLVFTKTGLPTANCP